MTAQVGLQERAEERSIMVHAVSKHGPLVTYHESGFPIKEGWLEAKRGGGRSGAGSFKPRRRAYSRVSVGSQAVKTRLSRCKQWQDLHGLARTPCDSGFPGALRAKEDVSCTRQCSISPWLRPFRRSESLSRTPNWITRNCCGGNGVEYLGVPREVEGGRGDTTSIDLRIDVPVGLSFPRNCRRTALSKKEVGSPSHRGLLCA